MLPPLRYSKVCFPILGGYYSYDVSSTIKVLCLNTALYYSSNNITAAGSDDPANQFAWMVDQLEAARMMKQKVSQLSVCLCVGHLMSMRCPIIEVGLHNWPCASRCV